jgi:membrane fusion protein, multidrug efflux system
VSSSQPSPESKTSTRGAGFVALIIVAILVIAGAVTLLQRAAAQRALADETERAAVPVVAVVHPTAEKPDEDLMLPGSLQAFQESPIYARTSGYLLKWYKDIGSRVTKGELLAEIDTPEIDQELHQAQAARQQIVEQVQLAKSSATRWQDLRKSDSVSQQETDERSSAFQQAQANLAAADANLKRLQQLESFKHVYAPFAGVITKRNVDPGALINAGSAGRELFDIAQVDTLRVFVNVPQAYTPSIHAGMSAAVTMQEFPGQKFEGKVARTADAIDPATRTLLTEVDVTNRDGRLLPGSYGQVHFSVKYGANKVTIPVNAMLFRAEGARVAVVGSDSKVHLRPISIGRDYGTTLEVLDGVTVGDQVIVNPSDSLEEGQLVRIAENKPGSGSQ